MHTRTKLKVLVPFVAAWAGAAFAQATASEPGTITVLGDRAEQAAIAADQAMKITLRPPVDTPLSRHYTRVCPKVFGIDPAYGELIADRVRNNARNLELPVGGARCQPNVWIGFVRDSKAEVERLRKQEPAMFAELKPYEIDRIFNGSGVAQVWHATEIRSVDGRSIPLVEITLPGSPRKVEARVNQQYQGGRLLSPIRSDINGTIVLFDRQRAGGKTVQQLADYASFRILAPVTDFSEVAPDAIATILHLFANNVAAPGGLTEFDWAYLHAYYKLDRGAKAPAVHDATKRAMLDGTGQKLREKAVGE